MTRRLRQPATALSALWLALLAVACAVPSLLSAHGPYAQNLSHSLSHPTLQHWLGTDKLGRDLLAQLIYGTRSVIVATLVAGAVAIVIGVPLGLIAGYSSGWREVVISRIADGLMALPVIIVLLAVAGILGNNLTLAMAVLGVILSAGFIRLVRTSTQAIRSELFVDAARAQGVPPVRIVTRHVLPNILSPVIVQLSFGLGVGILAVAGLSFLGLGPAPPAPTWGSMVFQATQNLSVAPWQLVPSGVAIMLTVLAFNFIGDAVIDRPRARVRRKPQVAISPLTMPTGHAPDAAVADDRVRTGLLVVEGLTVAFPTPTGQPLVVLDNVSFAVGPGEAVALVGESGCGKTMTSRAVVGMLPVGGVISAGHIHFAGNDVTALSESQWSGVRGCEIAYVAQDPLVALDPCFSVRSLLVEALRRHGTKSRTAARVAAAELLARVGIPEPASVLGRFAHQLSGGMAQRVAIALALTGSPKLLIADEPTSALDVTVQAELLDLLRSLQQEMGMAVLLVSHDFGVVADFCSRAVVMYAGQVVEESPALELFRAPAHPYTERLLSATPHNASRERELPTIEGMVPPPGLWPTGCHFAPRCPRAEAACTLGPIPLAAPTVERSSRCIFALQELEAQP
jgi:peptide/nickel transport system permease protein